VRAAVTQLRTSRARKGTWIVGALFVAFSGAVALGWLRAVDSRALWTAQKPSSKILDALLSFFSLLGSVEVGGAVLLALLVTLSLRSYQVLAGRLLVAFMVAELTEVVMKLYLPQVQPPGVAPHTQYLASSTNITATEAITGMYSYPSGHMIRGVILLGALYLLSKSKLQRAGIVLAVLGLGAARIYFEAHWASDMIGGVLLGTTTLLWAFGAKEKD
jgi:membrane-associated phospholipid phosphatase